MPRCARSGVLEPAPSAPHPCGRFSHLNAMFAETMFAETMFAETQFETPAPVRYDLRTPAEPSPPPIKEPPNPPENPDAPVREPDPGDPGQI
jgi:hypothetical protein